MEIKKIDEIIPYDRNPRKNEQAIEHVLESLKIHGQVKPIVLSAKGKPFDQEVICAGHTTFEALKKFGAEEVKVIVKEFETEKQFVDYNVRDNKTGEFALWDEEVLAQLGTEFEIDLNELGFDLSDEWESDIDSIENVEENLDGIKAKIQIRVEQDCEEKAKGVIFKALDEAEIQYE